jgi:serine/threonine-protein kinase RsbW
MESPMKRLTLEIESNLSDISLMAVAINAIAAFAGLDRDKGNQVELSLVEAVTNSILHAYHSEPNHRVKVIVTCDEQQLRFHLYDNGTPMRVEQVDRLIQGAGIVEAERVDLFSLSEGGRGLEIIHRTMDEIAYEREGGRNHLTLTSYLRGD